MSGLLEAMLGAFVGAGVAYALIWVQLANRELRHREELAAQHRELTAAFLDSLKLQVIEIRGQAEVRLLNSIFNHLAKNCLPAFEEARKLCDAWTTDVKVIDVPDLIQELQDNLERSAEAVRGIADILEANRNHHEIYMQFCEALRRAQFPLGAFRSALEGMSRHLLTNNGRVRSRVRTEDLEVSSEIIGPVTQFGEWIKQSMKDAARMLGERSSSPPFLSAPNSSGDQDFDLVI